MKHHDQSDFGGKGLFCLRFHITGHHQRKSGQELKQCRNMEAGTDTEAMEDAAYCLVPHDLVSLFSYRTKDNQPRDGTSHKGLGPPHINH